MPSHIICMFFKFHNKSFELISGLTSNSYDILNCMIESLQDLDLIRFHFSQKDTNVKNIQQPENTRVSTCLFSLKRQSIYFHVKVFTVPKSLSLSLYIYIGDCIIVRVLWGEAAFYGIFE